MSFLLPIFIVENFRKFINSILDKDIFISEIGYELVEFGHFFPSNKIIKGFTEENYMDLNP
jgi:hypothetical protein